MPFFYRVKNGDLNQAINGTNSAGILFESGLLKKTMINIDKLQVEILETIWKEEEVVITEETYEQKLLDKYIQPHLKYVKEKSNKLAGTEILTEKNTPIGLVPGLEYSYIEFQFAIEGNYRYKDKVFDNEFQIANDLYFQNIDTNIYLIYRTYSTQSTEGNSNIDLEALNEKGTAKRELIEDRLAIFNAEVDAVNEKLKTFIHNSLEESKQERKLKKVSLDQVNPF